GFPGKVLIFQGAVQNGNYIGLALMILTSLLAMYSLFRILFIMYFGDADGEQVDYNPLPAHRKGMIGILTVVVLVMGLAAPIVMNVTKNATELNT
ncbi:cation:proton antiporter, partial [Staphylococcus caprae]